MELYVYSTLLPLKSGNVDLEIKYMKGGLGNIFVYDLDKILVIVCGKGIAFIE